MNERKSYFISCDSFELAGLSEWFKISYKLIIAEKYYCVETDMMIMQLLDGLEFVYFSNDFFY